MNINKKLLSEIEEYCQFNDIDDIEKEVNRLLRIGFNIDRYGVSPFNHLQENVDEKVEEPKKTRKTTKKIKVVESSEKAKKDEIAEVSKEEPKVEEKPKKRVRIIKSK